MWVVCSLILGHIESSYLPSSSFATYQDMMLYCVTHYIAIHFCFFVHEHVHLGEIRQLAENTGMTLQPSRYL